MLNVDDEQTSSKPLVTNTHDNLNGMNSEENLRPGHLNFYRVGMIPPHFTFQH